MDEQPLTVAEVAERLRVRPDTVRRYLREGRLRGRKFGNRGGYRVEPEELRRFLGSEGQDGR